MKARHKKKGIKKYRYKGEFVDIPSDRFIPITDLQLYVELTRYPSVFDCISYFDYKLLLPLKKYITIKDDLIFTKKRYAPKLQKLKFTKLQAERDDGVVVYKIIDFNEQNLAKYEGMQNIEVLVYRRLGGMGDCILAMSLIEHIKNKHPNYKITLALPNQFLCLAENNPLIDNLIEYRENIFKQDKWDAIVDLSRACIDYEINTMPDVKLNRPQIFAESIGYSTKNIYLPKLFLTRKEIENGTSNN